jgi:hypothetical protein
MKFKRSYWLPVLLALVMAVGVGCAATQKTAEPAKADWQFHNICG